MASLRKRDRSPYWWACFTLPNGKRLQRSTKVRDDGKAKSRRTAQAIANAWEQDLAVAKSSKQFQRVASSIGERLFQKPITSPPVAEFLHEWVENRTGEISPRTLTNYRGAMKGFLKWLDDGTRLISSITEKDVLQFRNAEAQQISANSVNGHIKMLYRAFEFARKNSMIADNPFEDIKPLKVTPANRRPFKPHELQALLDVAEPEWASMIRFGYYTGQRLQDIATLRWSSIDLEQREIRFRTSKTGRQQKIPIGKHLFEHILTLPGSDDPESPLHPAAFAAIPANKSPAVLSKQFRQMLESINLVTASEQKGRRKERAPLSFHSLRDTATTALKAAGVTSPVAQEIIGHDSAEISSIYTKFDQSTLRDAVDRLEAI